MLKDKVPDRYGWIGKLLGKYKILKLLGCGGMGAVYQAQHTVLEKIVCIKILLPNFTYPDSKAINRFLQEAKAIAKLEHANIVQIFDVEEEKGTYYIVMEYITGQTLSQILEEKDAFTIRETLQIGVEIGEALKVAHHHQIIHRDIKPANIMITDKQQVKLTDFGLASYTGVRELQTTKLLGTPYYLSPEYIRDKVLDPRMDLYSLGATLYHLLSGEPPYTGNNPIHILKKHITSTIPSIKAIRADVPATLDDIIKKAMAKKPGGRYANAAEMVHALNNCLATLDEAQKEETHRYARKALELEEQHAIRRGKIRVLVVDDSQVMCRAITNILKQHGNFDIVGIAQHGKEALELIPKISPDVITLDFNMPELDGITTVKHIMSFSPCPIIMLSAFTYEGALTTFECLSCGAVDFLWKTSYSGQKQFAKNLIAKLENMAGMKLMIPKKIRIAKSFGKKKTGVNTEITPAQWIVVIGAGEGGYHSSLKIIPYLLTNTPCAIILVQEMAEDLVGTFADYLHYYSRITVKKLDEAEMLMQGVCYVINHIANVTINRIPGKRGLWLMGKNSPLEGSTFRQILTSAGLNFGSRTIAITLTGMINDAVPALKYIKDVEGTVIVQAPDTCLQAHTALAVIQEQIADTIALDIDIASVLWHLLKKKEKIIDKTREMPLVKKISYSITRRTNAFDEKDIDEDIQLGK